MGTYTFRGSAKATDPIYSSGPQVHFRPPSTPSTSGTAPSTDEAQQPEKKLDPSTAKLPPPPRREDFGTDEDFDEARGRWQETVGRIQGLVARKTADGKAKTKK